jgi:hydroxyacylglutathione hydrolase
MEGRVVSLDPALANKQRYQHFSQQPRQVHMITDRYATANTYLIVGERIIVVDPGSELNVRLALAYLKDFLHRTSTDIDLIVLTHLHPDHTAGAELLRRVCNAPIAASIVAQQLAHEEIEGKQITHFAGQVLRQKTLPTALHHLDLFPPHYADQMNIINTWLEDVAGVPYHPNWRVIACPGHTPDSICLYNPFSYELLCGDTVITLESGAPLLRRTAKRRQLEETLRTLRSLEVYYLYPGHGRPILSKHPFENIVVE